MTKPIRIQRSRKNKQVSTNGLPIVYVGRPSKFGNPFTLKDFSRDKAISNFRECLLNNAMVYTMIDKCQASIQFDRFKWMAENIELLRGKNLSCWCKTSCKCHADVLMEIANK